MTKVAVGDIVTFTGFVDAADIPDHGDLLVEGQTYTIVRIEEPEDEENSEGYIINVPNPAYKAGSKKKAEKDEFFEVDVFPDEFELADVEEAVEEAVEEVVEEVAEEAGLSFDDIEVGGTYVILTSDVEIEGKVTKKLKTKLTIEDEEGPLDIAKKDIESVSLGEAVEETEEEVAEEVVEEVVEEKPKPKAKAKAKADTKADKAEPKAKTKAKKAEAEEEGDTGLKLVLSDEQDDEEILAMVNDADDICELAEALAEETNHKEYQLGGVLYHVRKTGAYMDLDQRYAEKGGFELYCEERLGVGYRKAMYLIEIYTVWNYHGLDPRKLTELGWSKAQVIANAMTEENKDALIEAAESNTVRDLKDVVKEDFVEKPDGEQKEVVKRVTFKFRLFEDQAANVQPILEDAAEYLGLEKNPEQVFEHIITEWAQEHLNVGKKRK